MVLGFGHLGVELGLGGPIPFLARLGGELGIHGREFVGFPLDRQFVAKLLRFDSVYENSMDAVSDRDFIVEFLAFASLTMVHLSRISEEIILWCSSEFGFIELSDEFCTGSSMMPQKNKYKNKYKFLMAGAVVRIPGICCINDAPADRPTADS